MCNCGCKCLSSIVNGNSMVQSHISNYCNRCRHCAALEFNAHLGSPNFDALNIFLVNNLGKMEYTIQFKSFGIEKPKILLNFRGMLSDQMLISKSEHIQKRLENGMKFLNATIDEILITEFIRTAENGEMQFTAIQAQFPTITKEKLDEMNQKILIYKAKTGVWGAYTR